MSKFSSGEAIKFGWGIFKQNIGLLVSVTFVFVLIGIASNLLNVAGEFSDSSVYFWI